MKTLLAIVAVAGLAGAAFAAEKWTKDQQRVVAVFDDWAQSERAGDQAKIMALMAPELTCWNFKQPAPLDRAGFEKMLTDFLRKYKVSACAIQPDSILIKGEYAVAHGNYSESYTSLQGAATKAGGPWTSTLIRLGEKWLVLQLSYVEQSVLADKAVVEQELIKLEDAWSKAYHTRDTETLAQVQDADWVGTSDDGSQFTRAQDIEDVKSGAFVATVFATDDYKVRSYGDTAVVTGRQTEKSTYKGKDSSKVQRFTDTWVRRPEGWRCVATHLSRITAK